VNDLEKLAWLGSRAHAEAVPRLDVSGRVLARLCRQAERPPLVLPFLVLTGLSAVAASIVLAIAFEGWSALGDPLAGLINPLTMVMQ